MIDLDLMVIIKSSLNFFIFQPIYYLKESIKYTKYNQTIIKVAQIQAQDKQTQLQKLFRSVGTG
jgi:hypothetical protein